MWDRFCEAPYRYRKISDRIRKVDRSSETGGLFEDMSGWPQYNDQLEKNLRKDLNALAEHPPDKASEIVINLEAEHSKRRDYVWAELGEAPLAKGLEHLAILVKATATSLDGGDHDYLIKSY